MALDQATAQQLQSLFNDVANRIGSLTRSDPLVSAGLPSSAGLISGLQPQTPWQPLTQNPVTGPQTLGPIVKPAGYNNAIFTIQVTGGATINCIVRDGPTGPIGTASDAAAAVQSGIANTSFQVDGVQNYLELKVTAVNGGTNPTYQAQVAFTNATRPNSIGDIGTVAQGVPASLGNGWPVKLTDGSNIVAIDNTSALETSQWAKGNGANGDTAVRIATNFPGLAGVVITSGTPISEYAPGAGLKFVAMGVVLSVDHACAVLFEDGSGNEVLRTPQLQPNVPYRFDFGNGKKSGIANNHLFLNTTAPAGQQVVVNGYLLMAGDE